jgi:transcriptional regulator with PAS, ATPase and Fis domain
MTPGIGITLEIKKAAKLRRKNIHTTAQHLQIEACFFDQAAHTEKKSDKVQVEMDLKTLEQEYIAELMAKHEGNKEKVAGILGISQRSLYRKLEAMD